MECYMKLERLRIDPNTTDADKTWFWTFSNFLELLSTSNTASTGQSSTQSVKKCNLLIYYIEPNVYEFISECETYDQTIKTLKQFMWNPKMSYLKDIYYPLGNRKQGKA